MITPFRQIQFGIPLSLKIVYYSKNNVGHSFNDKIYYIWVKNSFGNCCYSFYFFLKINFFFAHLLFRLCFPRLCFPISRLYLVESLLDFFTKSFCTQTTTTILGFQAFSSSKRLFTYNIVPLFWFVALHSVTYYEMYGVSPGDAWFVPLNKL